MKKRIVLINHYGTTPNFPGATKNFELMQHISQETDFDSEYWICGRGHYTGDLDKSLRFRFIQSKANYDDVKVVRIKSTKYRGSSFLRQINVVVFDLVSSLKILFSRKIKHVILVVPPVTFFNVLAAKIRRINLIVTVEDLWPLFLQDMGLQNKFVIKYMEVLSNFTYKKANMINVVSEGMLNYVKDKVPESSHNNIWLSPLGVNVDEYKSIKKSEQLITEKKWKNDIKVMYIGAHGRANDLISVLNTISQFNTKYSTKLDRKVSFIFIGDGDQKENIVKYSLEKNIENVYFENSIAGSDVPIMLKNADICLTNLMNIESFKLVRPNKLFQYMALNKPIITGIQGEFSDIVVQNNAGIYLDFNHQSSSLKMYEFIRDEKKYQQMGTNGYDYVYKYGNRNVIFNQFIDKIKEVKQK